MLFCELFVFQFRLDKLLKNIKENQVFIQMAGLLTSRRSDIKQIRGDDMELLFRNTYIKSEKLIRECNGFALLRKPIIIFFDVFFVFEFCLGIYKLWRLHIIDLLLLFIPIWWFVFIILFCSQIIKIMVERDKELGIDNTEVVSEVTEDSIKQICANNMQVEIRYSTIKRGHQTENYIVLQTKAKLLYVFKKDGFTVGDAEGFLAFLRSKGIRIK